MRSSTYQPAQATPCIICTVPLDHFTNRRKIPDYLCSKCYREWGPNGQDQLDTPWMKYLMNQERYRRMKRQRRARSGISVEEISLDLLAEAGFTLPHTVVKENYDRSKPTRSR